MIELECKSVLFFSPSDEAAFFSWAKSISAVSSVTGRGRSIIITVRSRSISNESLRELLGLFKRYRVSMKQLAQFKSAKNQSWFAAPDKFWRRAVFGMAQQGIQADAASPRRLT